MFLYDTQLDKVIVYRGNQNIGMIDDFVETQNGYILENPSGMIYTNNNLESITPMYSKIDDSYISEDILIAYNGQSYEILNTNGEKITQNTYDDVKTWEGIESYNKQQYLLSQYFGDSVTKKTSKSIIENYSSLTSINEYDDYYKDY